LALTGYSAKPTKEPADSPPVLITKDGGKVPWIDTPPAMVSRDGAKPKWSNEEQLKRYAAKGDPQACFELAEHILYGDESSRDLKQVVRLLEQSGSGGISNAWFRLGKIYHDGLTGAPDYGRALDYYTRAARSGVAEAQHNIGAMLVSGRGVKRDLVEGLAWLIVATKAGAVSGAEIQVRDRLVKRPAEIKAAETRARELIANLPTATVRAVLKSAPAAESLPISPTPIITPAVDKPVIKAPAIDPLVPAKISLPPVAPPSTLPVAKP
jgi:hypothetical protein